MGVNKFVAPFGKIGGLVKVDSQEAEKQRARLAKVKQERDAKEVAAALDNLKEVAAGTENTMPAFVRCAEAYATVGEICDTLRGVFGVQREFLIF